MAKIIDEAVKKVSKNAEEKFRERTFSALSGNSDSTQENQDQFLEQEKKENELKEKELEQEKLGLEESEKLRKELSKKAMGRVDEKKVSKNNFQNNFNSDDIQQKNNELAEKQQEQNQRIQEEKAEVVEKVNELKEELAQELAKEDGHKKLPFPVSIFATPIFLLIMTGIDSLVALIPVAGDFIGLLISAVVWAIPCVLMFSLGSYVNIWKFFIFDLIFGLVVGTIGLVGTPALDAALDAIPEAILFLGMLIGGKKK